MIGVPTDPGLQVERTALAWRRSSLTLAAASLLILRGFVEPSGAWAIVIAAAGILCGAAILLASTPRARAQNASMARPASAPLPGGAALLSVAMVTTAIGAGATALVLHASANSM